MAERTCVSSPSSRCCAAWPFTLTYWQSAAPTPHASAHDAHQEFPTESRFTVHQSISSSMPHPSLEVRTPMMQDYPKHVLPPVNWKALGPGPTPLLGAIHRQHQEAVLPASLNMVDIISGYYIKSSCNRLTCLSATTTTQACTRGWAPHPAQPHAYTAYDVQRRHIDPLISAVRATTVHNPRSHHILPCATALRQPAPSRCTPRRLATPASASRRTPLLPLFIIILPRLIRMICGEILICAQLPAAPASPGLTPRSCWPRSSWSSRSSTPAVVHAGCTAGIPCWHSCCCTCRLV